MSQETVASDIFATPEEGPGRVKGNIAPQMYCLWLTQLSARVWDAHQWESSLGVYQPKRIHSVLVRLVRL